MITVKVEACWSGGKSYSWRLSFQHRHRHHRHSINRDEGQDWNRTTATTALDDLETLYKLPRRQIRFDAGAA